MSLNSSLSHSVASTSKINKQIEQTNKQTINIANISQLPEEHVQLNETFLHTPRNLYY